jgi:hypothetical protein
MLSRLQYPLPPQLLRGFYDAITTDDLCFVRALPQVQGLNEKDVLGFNLALLDVFAHAGKVTQLLIGLASIDFGGEGADATIICRANTPFTNMVRVFHARYGRSYYGAVIRRVLANLDAVGDIGIATPNAEDAGRVGEVVFGALDELIGGLPHVAPQIRHLASIIRACAAVRFNSTAVTFNILSEFYFTRFVAEILGKPKGYDDGFESQMDAKEFLARVAMPFSQMMQKTFKLMTFGNKYAAFQDLNARLSDEYFPRLRQFLWNVAEPPDPPAEYDAPGQERLDDALRLLIERTSRSYQEIAGRYAAVVANPQKNMPVSWSVATFVLGTFRETAP